jgi:hypothetical protein
VTKLTTTTIERTESAHAIHNAKGHLETIYGSWLAIQWLADGNRDGNDLNADARQILRDHGWDGTNEDDTREAIEQALREGPLSIETRADWISPSEVAGEAVEFRILISTGGPALRVVGDLSPITNVSMEWQDWFTPWTTYTDTTTDQDEALEWWAELLVGWLE